MKVEEFMVVDHALQLLEHLLCLQQFWNTEHNIRTRQQGRGPSTFMFNASSRLSQRERASRNSQKSKENIGGLYQVDGPGKSREQAYLHFIYLLLVHAHSYPSSLDSPQRLTNVTNGNQ